MEEGQEEGAEDGNLPQDEEPDQQHNKRLDEVHINWKATNTRPITWLNAEAYISYNVKAGSKLSGKVLPSRQLHIRDRH